MHNLEQSIDLGPENLFQEIPRSEFETPKGIQQDELECLKPQFVVQVMDNFWCKLASKNDSLLLNLFIPDEYSFSKLIEIKNQII